MLEDPRAATPEVNGSSQAAFAIMKSSSALYHPILDDVLSGGVYV